MFDLFNFTHKWNFPTNNYWQIFGIADSGVETFKGTPIKSLAREICQNSIDANQHNGKPTRIEFELFEIQQNHTRLLTIGELLRVHWIFGLIKNLISQGF